MVNYKFENGKFVIKDYQNAKTFANFLPAISGIDGKPLWAFYANVGQAMAGFGVNNKDTPITPFDSANLAYQNLSTRSFRTFIKEDNKVFSPFSSMIETDTLIIGKSDVSIIEVDNDIKYEVNYSTLPHRKYAGLVRKVTMTNTSNQKRNFEVLDGLPIIFPNGLSNYCYKELVSLMAAYCEVEQLDSNHPFIKFKTSTADNSIVEESNSGNGFFTVDQNNKLLNSIVDLRLIFGKDKSLINPLGFINKSYQELIGSKQQTENKLPCAFTAFEITLNPNEVYSFISLYGMFDNKDMFKLAYENETFERLSNVSEENEKLIEELLAPSYVKTGDNLLDEYIKQSFLDNNLRGGFPHKIKGTDEIYYLYSRKHGDMERDYNSFQIPSRYYSSGQGNFRDVNQNRRSDLYYYPFVKDYNIKIFFELIQMDGQNPLNVKPLIFKLDGNIDAILSKISSPIKEQVIKLVKGFEPSQLYTLLKDNNNLLFDNEDNIFSAIINECSQQIQATFAEGYWVDHWTYNVDLLENYAAVYPDLIKDLLLNKEYKYFYSPIYVEPRKEKYCLINPTKVRQYGAINLQKAKEKKEKYNIDINKTNWLHDTNGNIVKTSLLNKIFSLIVVKFSTLDSLQMGIEMECEKPGWNDAMNGLPGISGSALSESIELLRLLRFLKKYINKLNIKEFEVYKEQYELFDSIKQIVPLRLNDQLSQFDYWDKATTSREIFREKIENNVSGEISYVNVNDANELLNQMEEIITDGIKRSKELADGIIPSYLIHHVKDYKKTGLINHLGYETVLPLSFEVETIPPFLEATARVLKLGKEFYKKEDYLKIQSTEIYDKKLKFYKTCADIDNAPFEIGRVHAFTKGWLERECNFLHMTYKYLLGLLKAGYYEEFYYEIKNNFPIYMDPYVYGRSIIENSSFIVPTCNPDEELHGQGFFARLTGANSEVLNMITIMFLGDKVFDVNENNELVFCLSPKLSSRLFDENKEAKFTLFSNVLITYHNENRINTYDAKNIYYVINNIKYDSICGQLAQDIRNGKVSNIDVFIEG